MEVIFNLIVNEKINTKLSISKTTTNCFSYGYENNALNFSDNKKTISKSSIEKNNGLEQPLGIRGSYFTTLKNQAENPDKIKVLEKGVSTKLNLFIEDVNKNKSIDTSFSEQKNIIECSCADKNHKKTIHKAKRKLYKKNRNISQESRILAGKTSYTCGSVRGLGHVSTERDKKGNSILNGLNHCNSVYQCRLCAIRILSRKQLELETVNKEHIKTGGSVLLVSLTIKNSKEDSFESLLGSTKTQKGILWAYSNLSYKYKRRFQKLLDLYSVDFSVRVFESTWGKNGFHVHTHSLFYLKRTLSKEELLEFKTQFYELWKMSLGDVGLTCDFEHGIDIRDGSNAGKYIAKWSGASELSSGHVKKAKNGNFTMSQLNDLLIDENQKDLPLAQVKSVLKEYYKGCHGKKFMTWTGNTKLKNQYLNNANLEEMSDKDCVETSNIESKEKVVIGNSTFKEIYNKKQVHEFRTSFELEGFEGILKFANSLSISTKDFHFVKDVDLTEEDKLKKIDSYVKEFGFFPEYNSNDLYIRDYFILNYENLLNTAIDYYVDTSTLAKSNAYYPYVIEFCKQYKYRLFNDNF